MNSLTDFAQIPRQHRISKPYRYTVVLFVPAPVQSLRNIQSEQARRLQSTLVVKKELLFEA